MHSRFWDWLCLTLILIGAINWGLIGFFQFDLVAAIFGGVSGAVSRIIYALVGIAGLWGLTFYSKMSYEEHYDREVAR